MLVIFMCAIEGQWLYWDLKAFKVNKHFITILINFYNLYVLNFDVHISSVSQVNMDYSPSALIPDLSEAGCAWG